MYRCGDSSHPKALAAKRSFLDDLRWWRAFDLPHFAHLILQAGFVRVFLDSF